MDTPPTKVQAAQRLLLAAVVCAGLLVLAAGALLLYAFNGRPHGAANSGLSAMVGGKFSLVDQNGKPFTDADMKGKWDSCFSAIPIVPDVCPTTLNDCRSPSTSSAAEKNKIGRSCLSASIPTAIRLPCSKPTCREFRRPIVALTGTPAEIEQAAKDYRVYYAKHPSRTATMTWTTAPSSM